MTDEPQPKGTEEVPSIICIGCAKPIPEDSDFCPLCGAPIGATVWTDPYKQIFAGGQISRRFTNGRPRKWTMIAEMVIAAVFLPVNILMIVQERTIANLVGMGVLLSITAAFYYRLVRNYIRVYGKRT